MSKPQSSPPTAMNPVERSSRASLNLPNDTLEVDPPSKFPALSLTSSGDSRISTIRFIKLFPSLAIFVLASGLGVAVLAWLFSRRKVAVSEAFQSGYILVDEGTRVWRGMESATLRVLTATSFISTLISLASPILMALIAYRIAYLWLAERADSEHSAKLGPTPLQYGLLLQVLSASSVMSLYNSVRYLMKGKSRAWAPSYFTTAVVLGVVVYVITHLIGLADLWLHATTSAVLFNLTTPANSETLMTSFAFNHSLCDDGDAPVGQRICMTGSDGWANMADFLIPIGQAVVANYSSDRRVITLAEAGDMSDVSIVVPLVVDEFATFRATSFGALAQCESLSSKCPSLGTAPVMNCSNLGITVIPTDKSAGSIAVVAPYHAWDSPQFNLSSGVQYGPDYCCGTNPVRSLLQLRWSSQRSGYTPAPNPAVQTYPIPLISVYASCNLTFYNATVMYNGQAPDGKYWTLIPKETIPSDVIFATALSGPFAWQLVTENLAANIKSRAMVTNSSQEVMAALNQELGRLALGFVSGAFEFVPATDVQIIQPKLLGRYPLAPLLIFVILLLIYGLIALAVFIITFGPTSDVVIVPPELRSNPSDSASDNNISVLELAQLRMFSPLPLVAQVFAEPTYLMGKPDPSDADAKSVSTSEMDLFAETHSSNYMGARLRIGLEDNGLRPSFGIWKRKGNQVQNSQEQMADRAVSKRSSLAADDVPQNVAVCCRN